MQYHEEFALYSFALIAIIFVGFLVLFAIAYFINKRLDALPQRRTIGTTEVSKAPERLFWTISKWIIQGIIFISAGFVFVALSGFTPVPIIILWIFFFVVWGLLFLHKFRSFSLPTNQFIQLQNIFDEEDDFAIDDDINITSIPRKNHSIIEKLQHYIFTCKLAIRHKKLQFIVGLVILLIATCAIIFSSSCMCIAIHPFEINTGLSRKLMAPYCEPGSVCNTYFTLGTLEEDFIANFQAAEEPLDPFVWYDTQTHSDDLAMWKDAAAKSAKIANSARMTTTDELKRYICWVDMTIKPNTTYYVVVGYQQKRTAKYVISKEYKIRGIPNSGYSFVSGGDMSVDSSGHKLMELAAKSDPYFAMIGGDITYDNGFSACYGRWDEWFFYWQKLMVTPGGFSIPILAAIGNHEAGGFLSAANNVPYFQSYFPQETAIQQKGGRLTYHSHRVTKDLFIVVLDTDIVARIDGEQATWLESELQKAQNAPLKFALYHGNLYPGTDEDRPIAGRGIKYWEPSFDKYNLTVGFENHCHAYKRTKPIRNNAVAESGTVYLGDGAWGVPPRPVISAWYLETAASKQHIYTVTVQETSVKAEAVGLDGVVFDKWEKQIVN